MSESNPKPSTRTASVDFGLKRIGLAISDERKVIASALETIQTKGRMEETAQDVVKALMAAAQSRGSLLEEVIVGYPLKMSGQVGLMADEVNAFVEELKKILDIPVIFWDERLTSVQAERTMREGKLTRKKRAKHVDKVAAVLILQSYLDSQSQSLDPGAGRW